MFRSIFSRAFLSHILLAIIICAVLACIFFVYTTSIIQTQVLGSYQQLVGSASDQMDKVVSDMDVLSKDVLVSKSMISENTYNMFKDTDIAGSYSFSSKYLRNLFFDEPSLSTQDESDYFYLGINDTLATIINIVNGSSYRAKEIMIYDTQGRYISAPFPIDSDIMEEKLKASDTMIKELCGGMGRTELKSPFQSDLYGKEMVLFSFYRSFYGDYNDQQRGVIEIQQDFGLIERIVDKDFKNNNREVFIFDNAGKLIYPVQSDNDYSRDFTEQIFKKSKGETNLYLNFAANGSKSALLSVHSEATGWTTVQLIDNKILYAQLNGFKKWFLMVAGLILIFGALVALAFANSTTSSVRLLHKTIRSTELQNLIGRVEHKLLSAPKEIADVYVDFKAMCRNLDITIKESIDAKTKESEAHWKALQAQMNPHFIFNTLSVISEACDEGENEAASFMCRRLSDMLRYVTRSADKQTTLRKELNYTLDYLALMQKRYEEHLIYEIDIPDEVMEVMLPKLVLQPLVENSIMHGFKSSRPPWKIKLTGRISENGWQLEVMDNGNGMETGRLEEIRCIIRNRLRGIADESDGGLGLISTIERMALMHKKRFYYNINNVEEGGLLVIVGLSETFITEGSANGI